MKSYGKVKKGAVIFLVFLLAAAFSSCGSAATSGTVQTTTQESTTDGKSQEAANASVTENRKLVKDVSVTAETEEFTKADASIREAVEKAGGYVELSNLDNYGNARSESLSVRIPADQLDAFVKTLEKTCSVIAKSEQVEDITDTYNETESELNSLKTELETLNSLLAQAKTIEDTISIQDRISDVRSRIGTLEAQKKSYDSQISYSTVTIDLRESQVAIGSTKTVGERIGYGFRSTLHGIGTFFVELFIFLVSASPALLLIAAIVFLTLFIVKKSKHRKTEKRNQKEN